MTPHRISASGFSRLFLTALVPLVALVLLLGSGPARAGTVTTDMGGTNATGIENLDIGGTLYNVNFIVSTAMSL